MLSGEITNLPDLQFLTAGQISLVTTSSSNGWTISLKGQYHEMGLGLRNRIRSLLKGKVSATKQTADSERCLGYFYVLTAKITCSEGL
jgi:hypothetical protein